ncbi:hypothetical protein [Sporosarcina sp. P7]|uniref:hypothetical protein n=1 Tax=Sporosarcina sp. P7 TaxID=2048244 RepID=UPI000C165692|nr:hypothetical protein [Sporosarcina sp. P7]PID24582.1 hypothetical protein CSV60_08390 [Sporosarcina sp. P7]
MPHGKRLNDFTDGITLIEGMNDFQFQDCCRFGHRSNQKDEKKKASKRLERYNEERYSSRSVSQYEPQGGDEVEFHYTCDVGRELDSYIRK